ncbi:3-beta hydroxysteroid dehydrogenase [Virgibacillus phasianinus]|uniref:3-beta hydroxysteroid dehydrogenase n=1 Tax=Virgibacillus phasianinus TaxID=2017483 RepID=A0A220TY80_9BACI|nr:SDR family oxidoreductase [Virgibacillus phasianinus]ASK60944.1 3-beta hydroxysteroid dehydrogenase [Virgibacillus phasianinus]
MEHIYLMTGYPGFLASSLIRQLIDDHQQDIKHIHLLVLPSQEKKAREEIKSFANKNSIPANIFSIVIGDITESGLAISSEVNESLQKSVTHVFHLAAIYDLAVPKELAFDVNVNGTKNVNCWVKTLDKLVRYTYFSTAYVSGTREGKIYEHELSMGQTFRNHYEQTKYEAELLVENEKSSVPTTIIRPSIVKGNSKTGETIKFDGMYFMLNFLDHLRFLPIMTYLGDGEPEGNFVPSDYVLKAVSYLATATAGEGKTYHLTDPRPYKMRELHKMLSESYLGKTPRGQVPLSLAKNALSVARIRKWLQVEKEAMDYFEIMSSYDCSQAVADLEGSGIKCPDLKDTIEPMIRFYRKYKHDFGKQIEIR